MLRDHGEMLDVSVPAFGLTETVSTRQSPAPMRPEETIEAPTIGQRITCLSNTVSTGGELLRLSFWMRGDASPPPLHVHPRQEEHIEVVSGSVLSISGGVRRVLGPGGTISSRPVNRIPSDFVERTFALDRAGHLSAKGRGNPVRLATARPHEAEFFVPRVPIELQRAVLRALDRLGRWLPGARG